jgi:hypothetical protein
MKRIISLMMCGALVMPISASPVLAQEGYAAAAMMGAMGAAMLASRGAGGGNGGYRQRRPRTVHRVARRTHASVRSAGGGDPFAGSTSSVPGKLK